jgi:hypothetical protein
VRAARGVACALLLAACGSGGLPSPTLLTRPAASYLLTLDQLRTPGFTVVDAAHPVDAESLPSSFRSAGLQDSATERYFRAVPTLSTSNGPLDVRTTVVRFATVSGAHSAYAALTLQTDAVANIVPESAGALGDEAHADQLLSTSPDGVQLVEETLTWRIANLVSTLVVRGRDGGTGLSDALLLAHAEAAGQH